MKHHKATQHHEPFPISPKKSFGWKAMLLVFFLGLVIGWQLPKNLRTRTMPTMPALAMREDWNTDDQALTNPLLLCDYTEPRAYSQFDPLKNILGKSIDNAMTSDKAASISVYYRDLLRGRWTGVNENVRYSPASLLKVPTQIALLKLSESNPEILNQRFVYDEKFDANKEEHFKPKKTIKAGIPYTIDELIRAMIVYSDNNAAILLFNNITSNPIEDIYSHFKVDLPQDENAGVTDFITVKQYTPFLRVLFNATYLNRANSEKALKTLSEASFPQGIEGGVPASIQVAQKFGERIITHENIRKPNEDELHDCGIVYYPKHPYILCIMTKGREFDGLSESIQEISHLTYTWVDSQYNKNKQEAVPIKQ